MTNWIGLSDCNKFNGALVVLNLDKDSKLPPDYVKEVVGHISNAYARGHMVAYVFDATMGTSPIPDEFEYLEGSSISAISTPFGMQYLDFPLDPEHRVQTLSAMARGMVEKIEMLENARSFHFIGKVKIGGDIVLMPLSTINLK